MECLICSDVIKHARMGINACRPCAAFYKRTISQVNKLKCNDGDSKCRDRNPKTQCRKCRLARFMEVLSNAREVSPVIENNSEEIDDSSSPKCRPFLDHTSFYLCEPTTCETPLLDKIKKGYSLMCIIRKSSEQALKADSSGENDVQVDNLTLTPATYNAIFPNTRIAMNAMLEFANMAFEEFRLIEEVSKKQIIESSYSLMKLLDSTYRLCHHFPGNLEITMPGYTTYFRDFDTFFADCPDNIDKPSLIKEIKLSRDHSAQVFLALFGLALWNDKILEGDDELQHIGNKIRSQIMKELHHYYATEEILDYASRVGNIFCLLVNSQNQSVKVVEDFRVYRLLKMFDSHFEDK